LTPGWRVSTSPLVNILTAHHQGVNSNPALLACQRGSLAYLKADPCSSTPPDGQLYDQLNEETHHHLAMMLVPPTIVDNSALASRIEALLRRPHQRSPPDS
jgi:hypothetical protein